MLNIPTQPTSSIITKAASHFFEERMRFIRRLDIDASNPPQSGSLKLDCDNLLDINWSVKRIYDECPFDVLAFKTNFKCDVLANESNPDPILVLSKLAESIGCKIIHTHETGDHYYSSSNHTITIPDSKEFVTKELYVSTLAHELCYAIQCFIHSKDDSYDFSVFSFGVAELSAQIASIMLCSILNIDRMELKGYISFLEEMLSFAVELDSGYSEQVLLAVSEIRALIVGNLSN